MTDRSLTVEDLSQSYDWQEVMKYARDSCFSPRMGTVSSLERRWR